MGNRPGFDGNRPSQLPARSLQERRGDLQGRLASRDQIRDRGDIREDWHDRLDNVYDRHDDWHHGSWHGNFGDWWHHMWDDHTALMAFGVTMWGVNRLAYGFGYWGYDNPYYTETYPIDGGAVIDYSEPIAVDTTAPATTDAPAPGMADFDTARQAFYRGDYPAAMAATNKALSALPNDPIIHEFRALVLFAQGKYHDAAAGLYSVLAVGPGWDWTTLCSLYPSIEVYTKQLRALETYVNQHPQETDARFVLAYHCITTGNKEAGAGHLQILHKQLPEDRVITELLLMVAGPGAVEKTPAPAATTAAAPVVVPSVELFGIWNAVGEGKTNFELQLTQEGTFTWIYTQKGKAETVKGLFGLDENVLALQPETGGTMLAEITKPKGGKFDFQLLGAPPGDPGLQFIKIR